MSACTGAYDPDDAGPADEAGDGPAEGESAPVSTADGDDAAGPADVSAPDPGDAYGNPFEGCLDDEISIGADPTGYTCSPACDLGVGHDDCPSPAHDVAAIPRCLETKDGTGQCVLACPLGQTDLCPAGAGCKDWGWGLANGGGVCAYVP